MQDFATQGHLNFWGILLLLLIGLVIFIVFQIVNSFLVYKIENTQKRSRLLRNLPIVQGVVWMIFIAIFLFRIVYPKPIPGLIILGLLSALSWQMIRNFIYGIGIQSDHQFIPGSPIILDDVKGIVRRMGLFRMIVSTTEGQQKSIPYYDLSGIRIGLTEDRTAKVAGKIALHINSQYSPESIREFIQKQLLLCPFLQSNSKPEVIVKRTDSSNLKAEIEILSIEKNFISQAEFYLVEKIRITPDMALLNRDL